MFAGTLLHDDGRGVCEGRSV